VAERDPLHGKAGRQADHVRHLDVAGSTDKVALTTAVQLVGVGVVVATAIVVVATAIVVVVVVVVVAVVVIIDSSAGPHALQGKDADGAVAADGDIA